MLKLLPIVVVLVITTVNAQFKQYGTFSASSSPGNPSQPSESELRARIAQLETENAALLAQTTCKVPFNYASLTERLGQTQTELDKCSRDTIMLKLVSTSPTQVHSIIQLRQANTKTVEEIEECRINVQVEADAVSNLNDKLKMLSKSSDITPITKENVKLKSNVVEYYNSQLHFIIGLEYSINTFLANNSKIKEVTDQLADANLKTRLINVYVSQCQDQFQNQYLNTSSAGCVNDLNSMRNVNQKVKTKLTASEKLNSSLNNTLETLNSRIAALSVNNRTIIG